MRPPLPSASLRDCLRIPFKFHVEWVFFALLLALLLMGITVFLEGRMGAGAYVAAFFLGLAGLIFCVMRMVRRVIRQRNGHGPMRGEGLAAFWAALVLPPLVAAGLVAKVSGPEAFYRSRQAEAKARLLGIYKAEVGFRKDIGRYTLSRNEWGLSLQDGQNIYMIGVPTLCAVKEGVGKERAQWPMSEWPLSEMKRAEIENFFLNVRKPEDCKDSKEGFEAYAVGVIREGASLDVWRIDERGKLENLQRGY